MTLFALALMATLYGAEPGLPVPALGTADPIRAGSYYMQLGNAYASWEQWDAAFNCYRASVRYDQRNSRAQVRMARALFRLGRPAEATEAARIGLKAMPYDAEALRVFAGVSLGTGDVDLAEQSLRSLIRTNAQDVDALRLLGALLRQKGQLPEADSMLRAAVSIKPQDVDAWFELARCANDSGAPQQAVTFLRQVVDVQPGNVQALSALIGLLLKQDRKLEALTVATTALAREPNNPDLLLGAGRLLAESQRYDEAASLFRRAYWLGIPEVTLQAVAFLGDYSMARGRWADAAMYARRGLSIKPNLLPVRMMLVSALVAQSDFGGAADAIAPVVTAQRNNPGLWIQWIEFLTRSRRFDTAERALTGLIDQFRGHPGISGAAITLLVGAGRAPQCARVLSGATRRWASQPELGYLYYSCLRHTGRQGEALDYLGYLRQRFPDQPMPRRELGMHRFERADYTGAIEMLRPLFEVGHIDPQARVALGWSLQFRQQYGPAARVFQTLVGPKDQRALFDVARQLTLLGDQATAARIYDRLLTSGQGGYAALLGKARALANSGQMPEALALFDKALAKSPSDLLAHRGKVMALTLLGRPVEARAAASACIKALPTESMGYLLAGELDGRTGDWTKAVDTYLTGVTAVPRSVLLRERLGDAYLQPGADKELASRQYEVAAQIDPRNWYARWRLADAAEGRGQYAEAAHFWQQVMATSPDAGWPYRRWLSALAESESPTMGLRAGAQYLAAAPESRAAAEPLVDFAARHGLLDQLETELTPVLAGAPSPSVRDAYGLALLRRGDGAAATDYYQKLGDRDKLNALWPRRQGQAWELRGNLSKALECYRTANSLRHADLDTLALMAGIEAATGKATDAIERLTQTLRADWSNFPALERLLRTYAEQGLLPRVLPAFTALVDGDMAHQKKPLLPAAASPTVIAALGLAHELNGERFEALLRYRTALDRDPNLRWARAGLGRVGRRPFRMPPPGMVRLDPQSDAAAPR